MVVNKAGALAALSLGVVLSQQFAAGATLTPVIVEGNAVGGDAFNNATQVVLGDNGDVGLIGDLDDGGAAVLFSQFLGGGSYTHSIVASESQAIPATGDLFEGFENLSLSTAGGTSKLVFSAPAFSSDRAGLFSSTNGSSAATIFYSSTGRTLLTAGSVGGPVGYGVSSDGHVAFGTKDGAAQELHVNTVANTITTSPLTDFNQTKDDIADQRYFVKRVALGDSSVVGVGSDAGTWGVYDFNGANAPAPRYQTINTGLESFAPRRLLGATATRSVVIAESLSDPTTGGLFYEQGGSLTPIITGINPGGEDSTSNDDPIGQMTAGGKVAAYLPDTGLIYYDSAIGLKQLSTGTYGATTIDSFGLLWDPVLAPMVNDNGWVVFEAVLPGGDFGIEALLAWNPTLDPNNVQVVAKVGDVVNLDGDETTDETITQFLRATPSFESDVLRDGLNESNVVAFSVFTTGGAAVLTSEITVIPEPGSVALALLGVPMLLKRRRRTGR